MTSLINIVSEFGQKRLLISACIIGALTAGVLFLAG